MPTQTVLDSVRDFLTANAASIPSLSQVYTALPKNQNEQSVMAGELLAVPEGTGGSIYLFIEDQTERRIAIGGPPSANGESGGRKNVVYTLAMDCRMKSDLNTTLGGQEAFNSFRDGLTSVIRSNRNANNAAVVFSWGEGTMFGGPDIHWQFAVPEGLGGEAFIFRGICRVMVLEILNT